MMHSGADPRRSRRLRPRVHQAFAAAAWLTCAVIPACRKQADDTARTGTSPPDDWNVLLVTFDTTRFDHLSCYGYDVIHTPAIDSLAGEGVRYRRCYTVAPLTLPAHTSILTGLYPFAHGLRNNGAGPLDDAVVTLAEVLEAHGYRTGAVVAAYVLDARFGLAQGFADYNDQLPKKTGGALWRHYAQRNAEAVTGAALSWLDGPRDEPYFLWVHYFDPHQPYTPPGLPDGTANEIAYDREIQYADGQLGRLLDRVRALERETQHQTLIVFVADHGESLVEHGELTHAFFLYNATIQVPLIVRFPGGRSAGLTVDAPVSVVDIFPSVLSWLDLPLPYEVHGRTLPTATAPLSGPPRPLYFETYMPYDTYRWSPLDGVVVGRFKYIHAPKPEFYDLTKDPREFHDVIGANADRAEEYRLTLTHLRETPLHAPAFSVADTPTEPADVRALRALGYVGTRTPPPDDIAGLPNPKDFVDVHTWATRATQKIDEHDIPTCVALLARVLQREPANRVAMSLITELLENPETARNGMGLARVALAGDIPDPFTVRLPVAYAVALARGGDTAQAIPLLTELTTRHPDSPEAHNGLALCYLAAGQKERAELNAHAALKIDATFKPALATLGDVAALRGQFEDAVTFYERSCAAAGPDAATAFKMGEALRATGALSDAETQYRRAIELNPKMIDAYLGLASTYSDRSDWTQTIDVLRRAIGIDPQHADLYYNLGIALFQRGEASDSIAAFRHALRIDPNNGQAAINLGIALFTSGDHEAAIAALERAASIDTAAADAHYNLGLAYAKLGQGDQAAAHYEQALALRPDSEKTTSELTSHYLSVGDAASAVRVLRIGVRHHADSVVFNNMLAMVLATSKSAEVRDATEAVRYAEQAAKLTGHRHAEVLGTLAAALAAQGAFDRAVDTADRAIDLAQAANRAKLVERLRAQRALYVRGRAYRDTRF